jgi:tetratricopeptide (TPR) repeat protein
VRGASIGALYDASGDDPDEILVAEYKNSSCWKKAKETEMKILSTRQSTHGLDHPKTLVSAASVIEIELELASLENAKNWSDWTWEAASRVLGAGDPFTMRVECLVGDTLKHLGRYQQAERHCASLLARQEGLLGKGHLDCLMTMRVLATVYSYQSRKEEAIDGFWKIAERLEQTFGFDRPRTVRARLELWQSIIDNGPQFQMDIQKGGHFVNWSYDHLVGNLGPQNLLTLLALELKGAYEVVVGDTTDALGFLREALMGYEAVRGKDHPSCQAVQLRVAMVYFKKGQLTLAREMFIASLNAMERTLGRTHACTTSIAYFLGCIFLKDEGPKSSAEMVKASQYFQRVIDSAADSLGMDHPMVLDAREKMRTCEPRARYANDSPYGYRAAGGPY